MGDWLISAAHNFPSTSQKRRKRQDDATIQDIVRLIKIIRSSKPIECILKIRISPRNHLMFIGVDDAAHAIVEGRAAKQALKQAIWVL